MKRPLLVILSLLMVSCAAANPQIKGLNGASTKREGSVEEIHNNATIPALNDLDLRVYQDSSGRRYELGYDKRGQAYLRTPLKERTEYKSVYAGREIAKLLLTRKLVQLAKTGKITKLNSGHKISLVAHVENAVISFENGYATVNLEHVRVDGKKIVIK